MFLDGVFILFLLGVFVYVLRKCYFKSVIFILVGLGVNIVFFSGSFNKGLFSGYFIDICLEFMFLYLFLFFFYYFYMFYKVFLDKKLLLLVFMSVSGWFFFLFLSMR